MEKICYKCGKRATTKEHIPPKCIFPERKDVGEDYKVNLITVDSCEEHNLKKSHDDEFLMACVTGRVGNNDIAIKNTRTKLRRSFENTKGFIYKVLGEYKELKVRDKNGELISVLVGSLDYGRLNRCIDQVTSGLFFHEFKRIFNGQVEIIFGFAEYKSPNTNQMRNYIVDVFKSEGHKFEKRGNNPEVFFYQIIPQHIPGYYLFKMTFFEGTDFFISMREDSAVEHFDLAANLVKGGDQVTVEFNGNEYTFNDNYNTVESFELKGEEGYIKVSFIKVFGFPSQTSAFGGYDIETEVEIKSGSYFVKGMCYLSTGNLFNFYKEFEKSQTDLKGKAEFSNYENNLTFKISYNESGQVGIWGEFREFHHLSTRLIFEIKSDQSYLQNSLNELKSIVNKYGDNKGVFRH